MRLCPKGDDPLTDFTDYRSIVIDTVALFGTLGGFFRFTFQGQSFSFPADSDSWQAQDCQKSFETLPNVKSVKCSVTAKGSHGSTSYLVQFLSFPSFPYENNIYTNDGNPSINFMDCDTSGVTGASHVSCTITDVAVSTIPGTYLILVVF